MRPFEVFCDNLAAAIKASPYTRAEVSVQLGVSKAAVKSWCVGRRAPTVIRLLELCEFLVVDAESLFRPPDSLQERFECPVCRQSFRRLAGLRIHVALRAPRDDAHDTLSAHGVVRSEVSVLKGLDADSSLQAPGPEATKPEPVRTLRSISHPTSY